MLDRDQERWPKGLWLFVPLQLDMEASIEISLLESIHIEEVLTQPINRGHLCVYARDQVLCERTELG